jgi:alanine-glyoxylate transaminase/serine-glyoxylate transaminase/serine-pyruvate transaminase
MLETQQLLRDAYRTKNALTFPVSATGMAGMEACLVNLLEPGDKIVVCYKGFFGQRMIDVAGRAGAQVTTLEQPWGEVFDFNRIRETLKQVRPKVLSIVQAETSTGALQPLEGLGKLCHEFDTLLARRGHIAGCARSRSMNGVDVYRVPERPQLPARPVAGHIQSASRGVDYEAQVRCKAGTSISMVRHTGAAIAIITAAITMTAIREGLRLLHEEGLEARWTRHVRNHKALKVGLTALGLKYSAKEGNQLPQLNAVFIPQGVDDLTVRKRLLNDFGIEIGGGLGDFKGKVWRIGLMGHNSRPDVVFTALAAMEQCLRGVGVKAASGAGVAAAEEAYAGA